MRVRARRSAPTQCSGKAFKGMSESLIGDERGKGTELPDRVLVHRVRRPRLHHGVAYFGRDDRTDASTVERRMRAANGVLSSNLTVFVVVDLPTDWGWARRGRRIW